ncbi:MAG: hypothetical protein AABX55_00250 [Nanoarchaeota archaeon]
MGLLSRLLGKDIEELSEFDRNTKYLIEAKPKILIIGGSRFSNNYDGIISHELTYKGITFTNEVINLRYYFEDSIGISSGDIDIMLLTIRHLTKLVRQVKRLNECGIMPKMNLKDFGYKYNNIDSLTDVVEVEKFIKSLEERLEQKVL